MHISVKFYLGYQARNPDPQRGGEYKHEDTEGKCGSTRAHILLITAANDDTREGGMQRTGKHHHL